jgi:hypothetical protein
MQKYKFYVCYPLLPVNKQGNRIKIPEKKEKYNF